MEGLGGNPLIRLETLDVTSDEDVRRVVDLIVGEAGRLDIVVNNGAPQIHSAARPCGGSLLHSSGCYGHRCVLS